MKKFMSKLLLLPKFKVVHSMYVRYKEVVLYLFFGGLSFLLNLIIYELSINLLGINVLVANVISWLVATLFAFLTNKLWVFQVKTYDKRRFIGQLASFLSGRLITLLLEEGILFLFVTLLKLNSMVIKIVAQVIVIILNYIFSKLWIFRDEV